MAPRLLPILALLAGAMAGGGAWTFNRATAGADAWQEVAWPFPRDAWPSGRAYRCDAAACGATLVVTIRPKLGFCNCATGVSGDSEVDAVSDVDMLSQDFAPVRDGQPLSVGDLVGRARFYTLAMPDGRQLPAAGLALSHRCDVIAAAILGPAPAEPASLDAVSRLIASPELSRWIHGQLGKG